MFEFVLYVVCMLFSAHLTLLKRAIANGGSVCLSVTIVIRA